MTFLFSRFLSFQYFRPSLKSLIHLLLNCLMLHVSILCMCQTVIANDLKSPAVIPSNSFSNRGDDLYQETVRLASVLPNDFSKNRSISSIIIRKLEDGIESHLNAKCAVELANIYFFSKYNVAENCEKAYQYYHRASNINGNPEAHRMLGLIYEFGLGLKEDFPKSLVHYSIAAEGNDYYAMCILAYKYANGFGVEQALDKALHFYQRAAEVVADSFSKGKVNMFPRLKLTNEKDFDNSLVRKNDAIQFYVYNAERGDVNAQVLLGRIFYHGSDGFVQNFPQAFKYFKMAAEAGNEVAKGYIGLMYAKGEYVDKNVPLATEYCESAAVHASAPAYHCLGYLYETGEISGTPDFDLAIRNYTKGSEKDFAESHYSLGRLLMEYIPSFSLPKSMQYLTLASRHGHILALYELGKLNLKNNSKESKNLAMDYFKNVCERGDMGHLSFNGYNAYFEKNKSYAFASSILTAACGLDVGQINAAFILDGMKSWNLALLLWSRAAQQGFIDGYVKCGDYFYYGKITYRQIPDYNIAMQYYIKAEAEDNAEAAYNLAEMSETGKGVAVDFSIAEKYYCRSLKLDSAGYIAVFFATKKLMLKRFLQVIKGFAGEIYILISLLAIVISTIVIFRLRKMQQSIQPLMSNNHSMNEEIAAPAIEEINESPEECNETVSENSTENIQSFTSNENSETSNLHKDINVVTSNENATNENTAFIPQVKQSDSNAIQTDNSYKQSSNESAKSQSIQNINSFINHADSSLSTEKICTEDKLSTSVDDFVVVESDNNNNSATEEIDEFEWGQ